MKTLRMLPAHESPRSGQANAFPQPAASLLSTHSAWRILRRRTGGTISRTTFYRWVGSGRLSSIRLGSRIYIPLLALEDFIRKCLSGE
jgi:excisionase family DNA binding protein